MKNSTAYACAPTVLYDRSIAWLLVTYDTYDTYLLHSTTNEAKSNSRIAVFTSLRS